MSRARGWALVAAWALLASAVGCGRRSERDVLLVTLDTFRADRVGAYGRAGGVTPHLDRLAGSGVLFEHASAVTPITLPSHASILTGRYPTATGVRNNGTFVLPGTETTLAEILRGAGWATAAVIAAFPLQSRYGLSQGFDVYDDALPEVKLEPGQALPLFFSERDARAVTDRALDVWSRMGGDRRFLWVHYFDAHAPYAAPEPWSKRFADTPYDGEIAFVDDQLGRLIDRVRADAPDAVVAVVGDHGESLGEHGEKTHGIFVYEATIRVPMVLAAPGRLPEGARIEPPVSQVDLVPTLLGLLDLPAPPGLDGVDLRPLVKEGRPVDRPVYAESYLPQLQFRFSELTMLRRGALKYIDAPAPEIYDVASDPDELRNLAGVHPDEADLAAALEAFRSAADPAASDRAAGVLDAESEARLRSLGYAAAPSLPSGHASRRGRDPKTMIGYLRDYDRAVGLAASGKVEDGSALLRELIRQAPENFMARYQLAAAFMGAGRLDEALRELDDLVRAEPDFGNAHLMAAEILARLGRVAESVRAYETAGALAPTLAEPRFGRGRLLESVGRFEEAAAAYREALEREPDDREIARRLVDLRAGRGELARAVEELRTLTRAFPAAAGAWTSLAAASRRAGDSKGALDAIRRALDLDPTRGDALLLRADLALEAGQTAEADATYDRALRAGASRLDVLLGKARVHLALGRLREADAALAEALQASPRSSTGLALRGLYFERMGDRATAEASYRRALAVNAGETIAREGLTRLRSR